MSQPVTVIARMQAKPDQADELRAALDVLVTETRQEAGCTVYDLHVGVDDPTLFVMYEVWESREHLTAHGETDHIARFRERAATLLREPIKVDVLHRAG